MAVLAAPAPAVIFIAVAATRPYTRGMTTASTGHRKKVRHFHNPGDLHEFTFSCYHRLPLLTNDTWRTILSRHIDEANREESIDLVAFVYMPEHVHLLV